VGTAFGTATAGEWARGCAGRQKSLCGQSPIGHALPNDWMVLCHNKQIAPLSSALITEFLQTPGTLQIAEPFLRSNSIPDRTS